MHRPALRGIIPPLVTPLVGPDVLDDDGLERLIEFQIGAGVHGLFILGTTGEGPALSRAVRQRLITRTCAQVNQRIPVLVGVLETCLSEAIEAAEFAQQAHADVIVSCPPFYLQLSQADMLRFVGSLTTAVKIPIMLYNPPGLPHARFQPQTVSDAATLYERVWALKDSSGDILYLEQVASALSTRPEFTILVGPENLLIEGMQTFGIHGGVAGGANLLPRFYVELYDNLLANDKPLDPRFQRYLDRVALTIFTVGEPQSSLVRGLKAALNLLGICSDEMAAPYQKATANQKLALKPFLNDCIQDGLLTTVSDSLLAGISGESTMP